MNVAYRGVAFLFLLAALAVSGLGGAGIVALIWGPDAWSVIGGPTIDRSHPAFWVCGLGMLTSVLLSGVGVFFLLMLIWHSSGVRIKPTEDDAIFRVLRRCAVKIAQLFELVP